MNKNIRNKGLILIILILFIVMTVLNYFFLYELNSIKSLVQSAVFSSILLSIFTVKRKWNKKQDNVFTK
jgi:hypothetical protein